MIKFSMRAFFGFTSGIPIFLTDQNFMVADIKENHKNQYFESISPFPLSSDKLRTL